MGKANGIGKIFMLIEFPKVCQVFVVTNAANMSCVVVGSRMGTATAAANSTKLP